MNTIFTDDGAFDASPSVEILWRVVAWDVFYAVSDKLPDTAKGDQPNLKPQSNISNSDDS